VAHREHVHAVLECTHSTLHRATSAEVGPHQKVFFTSLPNTREGIRFVWIPHVLNED